MALATAIKMKFAPVCPEDGVGFAFYFELL
jgi:hypothetical protein